MKMLFSSARFWLIVVIAGLALAAFVNSSRRDRTNDATTQPPGQHTLLENTQPTEADDSRETPSPFRFTSIAKQAGIDFLYYGSPSPQCYMTEQNGGGVALLDYDNNGRLDVFLSNGSHFLRPAESQNASNRLFRAANDLTFDDVTAAAGLEAFGFGMGCAAGDFDNDGFTDLFVAYYGLNQLWRNNGDGTFDNVAVQAGVQDDQWATSAAMADLDGDGNLDLYVVNYVKWSKDDPPCYSGHRPQPVRILCPPTNQPAQADLLYHNLGNGRFEEVGSSAGVALSDEGKGLALAIADLDGDRRFDIYVANDATPNYLFRNLGKLRFAEEGVVRGVALSHDGIAGAGMGIAIADYNRDGRFDLFVTNFLNQANDLFENIGQAGFRTTNSIRGVNMVSRSMLAFGVIAADFDLNGWPDLFVANGHIWDFSHLEAEYEYEMLPTLLENIEGQRFRNVAAQTGDYFSKRWLGRAAAVGDLDNDGDPDLVVTHLGKPTAVLRNDSRVVGRSVRLKFIGTRSARQPLGARVEAVVDGRLHTLQVPAGGSFQASSDPCVLVASGKSVLISEVRIYWPGGEEESWSDLPVGATLSLIEGTGSPRGSAKGGQKTPSRDEGASQWSRSDELPLSFLQDVAKKMRLCAGPGVP